MMTKTKTVMDGTRESEKNTESEMSGTRRDLLNQLPQRRLTSGGMLSSSEAFRRPAVWWTLKYGLVRHTQNSSLRWFKLKAMTLRSFIPVCLTSYLTIQQFGIEQRHINNIHSKVTPASQLSWLQQLSCDVCTALLTERMKKWCTKLDWCSAPSLCHMFLICELKELLLLLLQDFWTFICLFCWEIFINNSEILNFLNKNI